MVEEYLGCFDFDVTLHEDDVSEALIAEEEILQEFGSEPQATTSSGRGRRASGRGRARDKGQASSAEQPDQAPRLPCPFPDCKKTLKTAATLKAHIKRHEIKVASSRVPVAEEFAEGVHSIVENTIIQIMALPETGVIALEVVGYAHGFYHEWNRVQSVSLTEFVWSKIGSIFHSVLATFATGLRSEFIKNCNSLLSTESFVDEFKNELQTIKTSSNEILNVFIGVFMHYCAQNFVAYAVKKMHGAQDSAGPPILKKLCNDDVNSEDFQQIIYHIGGSLVHSFYKKAKRYPDNAKIAIYCDILRNNFEETAEDIASSSVAEVSSWTQERDRGNSLIYINKKSHEFFVLLADYVLHCEAENGSLDQDSVFGGVLMNKTILSKWENLVGLELLEDESGDFLQSVCEVMVNCARKGIMKRRLHDALKGAYSSITLRHRVAK